MNSKDLNDLMTIPARRGRATRLHSDQSIKVINTHGHQVVDFWAFSAEDVTEFMSMEHTRPTIGRIRPKVGDALVTNRRRPILTLVEDTLPIRLSPTPTICSVHPFS